MSTPRFIGIGAFLLLGSSLATLSGVGADLPRASRQFLEKHCVECHDADAKKGGLDLTSLKFDPVTSTNFSRWVLVHDRVRNGEMPPKKKARPGAAELASFVQSLSSSLASVERARLAKE